MNMIGAVRLAVEKGAWIRPVTWAGRRLALRWDESLETNLTGPCDMRWRFIPTDADPETARVRAPFSLLYPEDVFTEWEVVTPAMWRMELWPDTT